MKESNLINEYVVLGKSNIHNKGVFAKKDITKGTKIIEYIGDKITKAQSEKIATKQINKSIKNNKEGAVYIFDLNKKYDINGNVSWNPARYINHSCNPNCEPEIIRGHIWIIAIKDIKENEEIYYNYGYDIDEYKDHPCKCGSKNCVGYILAEEFWPKIKKK
jgi:hypothetical protein